MKEPDFEIPRDDPVPHPKLDARLSALVTLGELAYGAGIGEYEVAHGAMRRTGPLAFLRWRDLRFEASTRLDVLVFITVTAHDVFAQLEADLPALRLRSRARTIATASVLLSDVEALEANPGVVAIEWAGSVRPTGTSALPGRGYPARGALGLDAAPPGVDGKGVIVGIVDVEGIDLYHPAFLDGQARSKVRALWDQRAITAPGRTKEERDAIERTASARRGELLPKAYGALFDRHVLDAEVHPKQAMPLDVVPHRALKHSHGTASAALAAGWPFGDGVGCGVAPGAQVVFVNTWGSGAGAFGAMTEVADAVAFVFEVADADRKPCVVNLSLGDNLGGRGGRSPLERFIDELVGPGRSVVVAAGNSHDQRKHRALRLGAGEAATLDIEVGHDNRSHATIEIWYRGAHETGTLDLRLEAPDGEGPTAAMTATGVARMFDTGATRAIVLSTSQVAACPGERLIRVELLPLAKGAALLPGVWRLHLSCREAACEAHAWIEHRYVRFAGAATRDDVDTLTTPGSAARAITVGAHRIPGGETTSYSGRGPGRGAALKPDVLAPGEPVLAACASSPVRSIAIAGTSAAAAVASGAVALAYQRFGADLSREQILDLLAPRSAANTGDVDGAPLRTVHLAHWLAGAPSAASAPAGAARQTETSSFASGERQAPSNTHPVTERNITMSDMNQSRPAVGVQIMAGEYTLHQGETLVGKLFVEEVLGPTRTREHWMLYAAYRWPSVEFPVQEILFRRTGEGTNAEDFLHVPPPPGSTYVIAECAQQTLP